jgi:chromosome segregation ATPase
MRGALAVVAMILGLACLSQATLIDADKNRPVTKVINMLKDMQTELAKENEADQDIYDTTVCWCETNDKAKTKAISDGEQRISDLQTAIEDLTQKSSHLNTEIKNLEVEVANNEKALESGTALRRKQLAEFNAEEKDMLQSISSMKGAVTALSKHHEDAAFLQAGSGAKLMLTTATTIQSELKKHHHLLAEVITPHQRKAVTSFVQTLQPQSGEIFGIINGMKDSFEHNLEQSQKEESANDNAYEDMKKAKTEEISSGKTQLDTKTQQLADTDEKNARSKQDLEDTQATLEQDTVFLSNLKKICEDVDAEFAERRKSRTQEIEAVGKALTFLTSDEAHDLFTRTFNNFVQMKKRSESQKRAAVYKILMASAKQSLNPQLAILATRTRIAQFEVMKESLQKMIEPLIKEKEEEIAERDFCIAELNKNEKITAGKSRDKSDSEASLEDARMAIEELTREIAELQQTIKDAEMQFKRAGEDRENENHEFQITVADQRATQKLLYGALKALKSFYGSSLAQTATKRAQSAAGQTPPTAGFAENKNKGGIVGMVQGVIKDAQNLEAESIRTEEEAAKAYEDFVKDTNDSFEIWRKALSNKKAEKGKVEVENAGYQVQFDTVVSELKQLGRSRDDLHAQCDFALKNFDLRQATRDEEIGALKQSIAILGGSSFGAFLSNLGR